MPAFLPMSSPRWHVGSMGSIGRKSVEVYDCGIQESARLNIKTRHCISGCVEPSFDSVEMLCINYVESSISMKSIFDFRTLMYHPSFTLNDTPLAPCRHGGQDPPSPSLLGLTPVVASRHREARSNPFTIDLCKICFKKKKTYISFPITYPTTNDYSRLQTFNQRVGLDKGCIFATIIKTHLYGSTRRQDLPDSDGGWKRSHETTSRDHFTSVSQMDGGEPRQKSIQPLVERLYQHSLSFNNRDHASCLKEIFFNLSSSTIGHHITICRGIWKAQTSEERGRQSKDIFLYAGNAL